jgi:LmbE family N-acetylglucosaminyl deacetylase
MALCTFIFFFGSVLSGSMITRYGALYAQPTEPLDAARLQMAINKLSVLGSVLYVAAHPDDENTAVIAYYANHALYRTAYISLTRGDGGQNLIGDEQGALLGLIRTQELLAARRKDRGEQFFTRAVDFGFSKNPEETFRIWDKQKVLGDVVWAIRTMRPDVMITRFPPTAEAGHGHHTASAMLAEEAFKAAGDATKFPEQLRAPYNATVWQPKRLVWNGWPQLIERRNVKLSTLPSIDVGAYNLLLGKSYTELAAESRSMHKSQGFGASAGRGENINYFLHTLGDSAQPTSQGIDLFSGIDHTWGRVANSMAVQALVREIQTTYQSSAPQASIPKLVALAKALRTLDQRDMYVVQKQKEVQDILRSCLGMWIEAISETNSVVPGTSAKINVGIVKRNGFEQDIKLMRIRLRHGMGVAIDSAQNRVLKTGDFTTLVLQTSLPQTLAYSQPYWLTKPFDGAFQFDDQRLVSFPDNPPALVVEAELMIDNERFVYALPVLYRRTDPIQGEQYRPVEIVPAVSVSLNEQVYVVANNAPKKVRVMLRAQVPNAQGRVVLSVPAGWAVEPKELNFSLSKKFDETDAVFTLTPTAQASAERGIINAQAIMSNGQTIEHGIRTIAYSHIVPQTVFPPAKADLVRLTITAPKKIIGYIEGAGDRVPQALLQIGYDVVMLSDKEIETGDLQRFSGIIAGVRAYNTRDRLATLQPKLMQYVDQGGVYVVQYNTGGATFINNGTVTENIGPYPFTISRGDRVTDEQAEVQFLVPNHPVLTTPNMITAKDFTGWVQERGLYFASQWAKEYTAPFGMNDPGEPQKQGSLLVANYGKGRYVYTGLAFFRELPAGVPGAFALMVNLLSK